MFDDDAAADEHVVPVRLCPACGEEEMMREPYPCYHNDGDYAWRCAICGCIQAGGEDPDSELYTF